MLRAECLPTRLKAAVTLQCSLRLDPSRGKCVDPNILPGVIDRHNLGELNQCAFGRAVGGAARAPDGAMKLSREALPAQTDEHKAIIAEMS